MSSFGTLFRVTTFGESHCRGVGAIVDGVPPCLPLTEADIQPQLSRRRPGQSTLTTPRCESDRVSILSGTERGVTLGTPVALFVPNEDTRPSDYHEMAAVPRPGHADYTYQMKYGTRASSGGGRSSARETVGRVAAGAIAELWLHREFGTRVVTFVSSVGTVALPRGLVYAHAAGGGASRPWTREEVDTLGTLSLLRDPATGWRLLPPAPAAHAHGGGAAGLEPLTPAVAATLAGPTAAAAAAQHARLDHSAPGPDQHVLDALDEAAFLAVYNATSPDYAAQMALGEEARSSSSSGGGGGDGWGAPTAAAAGTAELAAAPMPPRSAAAYARPPVAAAGTAELAAAPMPPRSAAAYAPGTPAYETHAGLLLDMHGAPAVPPAGWDLAAARTSEVFPMRCPHAPTAARMASLVRSVKGASDSTGGVLTTVCSGVPVGLGEPVFDKAEALLAHAMLSLPATKGFEMGSGFAGTALRGSVHNDAFVAAAPAAAASSAPAAAAAGSGDSGPTTSAARVAAAAPPVLLATVTNNAGGTLGGITSGGDLVFRVAIKPVSTIGRPQATATFAGEPAVLEARGRHDPCVLPRAPPLVEAMAALVLADLALLQRARCGGPLAVLPHGLLHS